MRRFWKCLCLQGTSLQRLSSKSLESTSPVGKFGTTKSKKIKSRKTRSRTARSRTARSRITRSRTIRFRKTRSTKPSTRRTSPLSPSYIEKLKSGKPRFEKNRVGKKSNEYLGNVTFSSSKLFSKLIYNRTSFAPFS